MKQITDKDLETMIHEQNALNDMFKEEFGSEQIAMQNIYDELKSDAKLPKFENPFSKIMNKIKEAKTHKEFLKSDFLNDKIK